MVDGRKASEMLLAALELAAATLRSIGDEATQEVFGDRVTDISTRGDLAVSRALIEFFGKQEAAIALLSEESGRIELDSKPEYLVAFDDIDGTDNFFRGRGLLPYCTAISIFEGAHPRYGDVMAAGIIEHRSGTTWIAGRGQGSFLSAPGLAPRRVSASKRQALDRRSLIVVDQYSAKERAAELNGLAALAWLKDFGSSALHLAGVASGLFDGFVNLRHKAHELGAGYLLIAESGGRLVDLDGESLDERPYDFDDTIAVVAAGSRELAEAILECLRRAAF